MLLFDGIVNNIDRHWSNWGFYTDSNTNNILELHPLFDHNCALYCGEQEYYSQIYQDKTLLETAIFAYNKLHKPKEVLELFNWLTKLKIKHIFNQLFNSETQLNMLKHNVASIINS